MFLTHDPNMFDSSPFQQATANTTQHVLLQHASPNLAAQANRLCPCLRVCAGTLSGAPLAKASTAGESRMYLPRNTDPHLNAAPLPARLGPMAAVSALRDPADMARLGWAAAAFFCAAYAVYIAQLTSRPFKTIPTTSFVAR
jgi:hypothetical protein